MLKEHIVKCHPEEEMPEELLAAEPSYLVAEENSAMDGEMDMDSSEQGEFSHVMMEGGIELEETIIP